ncbi:MAG: metallophosphoesterase [Ferruginibacter sp.]
MNKNYLLLLLAVSLINSGLGQTNIFPYNSSWKYLDNGTNQGTGWIAVSFNDAAWPAGNGQLGYGDGDEATVVSYGANANNKFITTYFRKTISITNPSAFSGFTAKVKRDDGVIVYLNGTVVYRNNIAAGTVTNTTLAASASDDGATAQSFNITPGSFVAGNNVIAVEIHQSAVNSSDISFDMELAATPVTANAALIAYGSQWKYLDNGSNQGTAWRSSTFADATWAGGNAQLGYGDGDETTIVSYGPNGSMKFITTYFRKTITIADTTPFTGYTLNIKRDDGAVVYINGTEVFRSNMPAGTISYTSLASASASDDGNTPQTKALTISQIKQGNNTLAVEIHQNVNTSSDLSFDLELIATTGGGSGTTATLTRGPYMNTALQNGIVIRWRTNVATGSKVSYGTAAGSLTQSLTDNTATTEHVVTLTGLVPNTLYYYSIGSASQTLQGDANNYFRTMPVAGSTQKIRIMAMGDMGNNSANQVNVRNAWQAFNGSNYTDAWLLMGDNAYANGTDAEYQTNFFNIYQGSLTRNHVLWPATGNHEYANSAARQADHAIAYFDMFTLPKNGEAGGVASNTEAFYSFNYGNVHFVALDSYGWESGNTRLYDTLGTQAIWLKQDLAANILPWTVVYFHHPPYSMGTNSDTQSELVNIRQKIVPILERYKVDLVLNGHSHIYERSFLLNGHYGVENTFNAASHALSSSSAKYDGSTNSCTYIKNASATRNGIVYAVVGSAGQLGGTTGGYPHNAMYYSNAVNGGTLFFEVENNRLSAKWICADGVIRDNFTIMKNVNKTSNISITSGSGTTLTASWIGNYNWSAGGSARSITVNPVSNTTYTVTDGAGCITDVFNVTVTAALGVLGNPKQQSESLLKLYPTILRRGQSLYVQSGIKEVAVFMLTDLNGRVLNSYRFAGNKQIETNHLSTGIYFLKWNTKNINEVRKFVILND